MAFAHVSRPATIVRPPFQMRVRWLAALGLAGLSMIAATGVIADHVFHEPTTFKYVVTVVGPLLLSFTCISRQPLRVLVGGAIVTAPWDLNMTVQGLKLSPIIVLLALAAFVCLADTRITARRATPTGTVVAVALALFVPAFAIGHEQPHFATWIAATLIAGWLAFRVAQEPDGLRFLLSMLVLSATFQGLAAFYEYGHHANLNLYSSEINQTVTQSYYFNFAKDFRPAGTLPDPDSLGNVLALACPLGLMLTLTAGRRAVQIAWAASTLIVAVALTLSFSRMSWIGGLLGIAIVVVALPGRRRLQAGAVIAALLVATVAIALSLGGSSLRERFNSIENPTARVNRTAKGDEERKHIWNAALTVASSNPVVGVGFGRLQEHLSEDLGASHEGLHAQSVYFQFLAEAGVLGLLGLLLLVGHAATGIVAGLRRDRVAAAGMGGALVAILLGWTTDTTARYTGVSVMIAALFGAAMAEHARRRFIRTSPFSPVASGSGGAALGSPVAGTPGWRPAPPVPDTPTDPHEKAENMDQPKLVRDVTASVFNLVGRFGAITFLSGLSTIAITRLLGPSGYGAYAAAVATWSVLGATADFGFSLMLSRDLPHLAGSLRAVQRSAYEIAIAWSALLALALVGLAFSAGITSTRGLALLVLAPSMVFNGLNPARVFFVIKSRTGTLLRIDVVTTTLQVAATVAIAALGFGVVAIAAAVSVGSIVNNLVVAYAAHRMIEPSPVKRVGRRGLIARSVPLGMLAIMTRVYLMIDLVLLGWLITGPRLGEYAAASKLLTVLATIAGVVAQGSLPAMSSLIGRRAELESLVGRVWAWLAVGVIPVFVAVALFAPTIVKLLLGHSYQHAAPLLQILCVAGALSVANNVLGSLMIAHHRTRALFIQNALAIAINVAGNLILVPKVGVIASAWLTAGCELLVFVAAILVIRREITLWPSATATIRPAIAMGCGALVALLLSGTPGLAIAASSVTFLAAATALGAWPSDFAPRSIAASLRRAG